MDYPNITIQHPHSNKITTVHLNNNKKYIQAETSQAKDAVISCLRDDSNSVLSQQAHYNNNEY